MAGTARGVDFPAEFLNIWVPSEDTFESIVNMILAALDWGESRFDVSFLEETFNSINGDQLINVAGGFGDIKVEREGGRVILSLLNLSSSEDKVTRVKPIYQNAISAAAKDLDHLGQINERENCMILEAEEDGVALFVAVNRESQIIEKSSFAGAETQIRKGIFEAFCRNIENTPLQDAHEYGVVRLESILRHHSDKRPVPGVIIAPIAEPAFKLPMKLIRNIYLKFCGSLCDGIKTNFFTVEPSDDWIKKDNVKKISIVQAEIDAYLCENPDWQFEFKILKIENNNRITGQFCDDAAFEIRGNFLLAAEKKLRASIEPTLELYLVSAEDLNIIRQHEVKDPG